MENHDAYFVFRLYNNYSSKPIIDEEDELYQWSNQYLLQKKMLKKFISTG